LYYLLIQRILNKKEFLKIIEKSAQQVGPGVFYSTIVVIASFLPIFLLTGMEGKLFHPLAWTKTFILLIDAFLAITLTPVLISFIMKKSPGTKGVGRFNRLLEKLYLPVLLLCLKWRRTVIVLSLMILIAGGFLLTRMGTEFMPPLDEGSILFMPVTMPDVSNSEVKRIMQIQDKIIKSVPEVKNVLGKAGRANTATDNSPISMIETIILLKPSSEWRKGVKKEDIINELNAKLQIPGVVNGFTQPIINRINMLSTGIRTDVGLKVYGQNLDTIYSLAKQMKQRLQGMEGVEDLYVEPITGGKYLDIIIRRNEIVKYGLTVDDVNMLIETVLGGTRITSTIEGRERYSVNARFAQDFRNSIEAIRNIPVKTPDYGHIPLSSVADIQLSEGPPMINSENAMLRGTVLFNVRGRDLGGTVHEAQAKLNELFTRLPKGYSLEWSGQWENQIRASRTLMLVIPVVLLIIFLVLYFTYRSSREAFITMITVPFALVGGVVMVWTYDVNLSVAVAVGFIALFGVAVETSMLMTIYIREYLQKLVEQKRDSAAAISRDDIRQAIVDGAVKRLRPKLMTVSVALFGLIPVLWAKGAGSDIMLPIALPLIGGIFSSTIYVLLLTPVVFEIKCFYELKKYGKIILHENEQDN
jgi:Cu(I)/Ag(I) efflux system membrane protein CusA/SilA